MKRIYQQSSRFSATPAQIRYLKAIHQGLPVKTNWATRNRCFQFLEFPKGGGLRVKPEIVTQFNLGAKEPREVPEWQRCRLEDM